MVGGERREARKDPWAAAYATESSLEAAEALLSRTLGTVCEERRRSWQRGRATTWAEAGSAAYVLELAKALSDFVHREGESSPKLASAPPRPRRRPQRGKGQRA